ncbi:hypothetical protein DCAR_0417104 [Daucus carota subsp. sativus]|uniref:Uncharacterized protein n=1 Tax=Daucus carota subsp. sativus TaxID=79200 RepID=A0AAF0WZS0_DAUCS|nr:hypothetical protein DCAR_0417104 [Daucus carota subsp. sativus]
MTLEAVCDDVDVNGYPGSKHEQPECSSQDISNSRCINSEEKTLEPAMDEITPAILPEAVRTEVGGDSTIQPYDENSDHASPDPVHSCKMKLHSENNSVLGNPSKQQLEAISGIRSPGSVVTGPRTFEGQFDVANSNEHDKEKPMVQIRSYSISPIPCSKIPASDSAAPVDTLQGSSVNELNMGKSEGVTSSLSGKEDSEMIKESNGQNVSNEVEVVCRNEVELVSSEVCDSISPNPCSKLSASDSAAPADALQGSFANELDLGKSEGVTSNISGKEDTKVTEESNAQNVSSEVELVCRNVDLTANLSRKEGTEVTELSDGQNVMDKDEVTTGSEDITTDLLRKEDVKVIEKQTGQKNSGKDEVVRGNDPGFSMSGADLNHSVQKTSDFKIDYDIFDPLEVARKVATELEREVDCREPSRSSSERASGGRIRLPESPDPIKGKNSIVAHHPCKDMSTGTNLTAAVGEKVLVKATALPIERETCIVDSEVAQNIEPDEDKLVCGFDLNENVSDDNMDNQTNSVTAPISLVTASMAATTSDLPLSPLQFDVTHGFKGSAKTSAFCLAPMHKVSEGESSIFATGSSSSLFRKSEHLDFDLNVAESEYWKISDLPPSKETPNSAARPSGDASLESFPKRSNLLQLDLNCASDSGDAPSSYWRKDERVLPHFTGQFSRSASSSSSLMQPSLKTIDLNDQPSYTEFLHPALTAKSSTSVSGGYNTNTSVISLMGTRIAVNQKDDVPQTFPFFNDRIVDPALDASMPRSDNVLGSASSSLYARSYMYGNNGPPYGYGPTVPESSSIYGLGGQTPYMVDSRGSPVGPQVLGRFPALPSFTQQPSFSEGLAAAPADSIGFVHSRHGFDRTSSLMFEGRSRDAGYTRQLLNPGQDIPMDGEMRGNPQSTSSSGVGGKRKEMDGGWEPYPYSHKHHHPMWK